ncbi:MAG TPA: phosphotransferase, partial [Chloroflexota bacterium]|nr:phosphotransferase [Chloroflexota bacterium]
ERSDRSPETLRRLGEVVGHLHALPPVPEQDPLLQRRAGALPASDLPFGLQCLARIADRVPNEWRAEYTILRACLLATCDCEDLPDSARGLIHNDCHLANALRTPPGEVVFFDWDSAGQGPRVAALGLLLYSCAVQAPDDPPIPPDLTRVDHVLDGYCRHHALSDAELRLLPDAVRYRPAVVAARELAATVDHRRAGDLARWHSGWWARFAETDAVATRALTTLERYRAA